MGVPPERGLVRYESVVPNRHGRHPGIFAMLTGLRRSGRLSEADAEIAATLVARSYELHTEPDAGYFDTEPRAISWFRDVASVTEAERERATALRALAFDVMELLGHHGIACREIRCGEPGEVTYSDAVQVVAVPHTHDAWPF